MFHFSDLQVKLKKQSLNSPSTECRNLRSMTWQAKPTRLAIERTNYLTKKALAWRLLGTYTSGGV